MTRTNARSIATLLAGAALPLALLAPTDALAWRHTRQVWAPEDLPVQYTISDYAEDSVPAGFPVQAVQDGYANWLAAECADIPTEFIGTSPDNTPYIYNFENHHSFDDPGDDLAPGVLAATLTLPPVGAGQVAFVFEGQSYYRALDSDIVFNNDVDFTTDEAINEGGCADEYSMIAIATHEIGHQLGLGHSCEDGELCNDPDLLEATMYWSVPECNASTSSIAPDDIEGLTILYGPYATFDCSNELDPGNPDTIAVGNIPFELKCAMRTQYGAEITGATWYWGDGATSTDVPLAAHTYEESGNFTVRACFEGTNDTCGDWTFCTRREGYVRACGEPDVDFTVEHVDGRTYQLLNQTDISVYGCIFAVQWDIFRGNTLETSIEAWEPEYTFDEDGEYTIVLNVGGPAGTSAQELTFDVKNRRGEGYACNTTGPVGLGGAWLLLVLFGIRRRRS